MTEPSSQLAGFASNTASTQAFWIVVSREGSTAGVAVILIGEQFVVGRAGPVGPALTNLYRGIMPADVPVNDVVPSVSPPPGELLSDELVVELLAGAPTREELTGPGAHVAQLTERTWWSGR